MNNFEYVRPASVGDAVAAAAEPGAAYLAAGTNLLDLMKGGISAPTRLVDVTHLPDLDRIEPLLQRADRNCELERQMKGLPPQSNWTP